LSGATLDLRFLIGLTEALLGDAFGRVTELGVVTLDDSFDLARVEAIVAHFDVVEGNIIEGASLAAVVDSSTAFAIIAFFGGTALHWVGWLVDGICLAEALLFVAVVGVTVEGSFCAHHVAVGEGGGPTILKHVGKTKGGVGVGVLVPAVEDSTPACTEAESQIICTMFSLWNRIWSLVAEAVTLMTTMRVSHIEIAS